jgi:hypothetical protein
MWQTVITIDKKYDREYQFIIEGLEKIKDTAYAVRDTKNRHHINVAANEENLKRVRGKIAEIISDTILLYMKYRYLSAKIHFNEDSYLNSALLSALVYCDRSHETALVLSSIRDVYEYSIDAIFRFRLSELISNWDEVVGLVNGLVHSNHTSGDIYSLIQFILEMSDEEKSVINIVKDGNEVIILNVKNNKRVDIPHISEKDHTNIISAIFSANPYEVHMDKELFNSEMLSVVNNIVTLKPL